jgi:hypothetical protein
MWGTQSAERKQRPLRIKPDSGQVAENSAHSPMKQRCDVLHDEVSGSNLANQPEKLSPQAAPLPVDPLSLPGIANVLTRESAADDVDVAAVFSNKSSGEGANIVVPPCGRPMPL